MRAFLLPAPLTDVPSISRDHLNSSGVPLMACITEPHWFFLFSPQRPALPHGIGYIPRAGGVWFARTRQRAVNYLFSW